MHLPFANNNPRVQPNHFTGHPVHKSYVIPEMWLTCHVFRRPTAPWPCLCRWNLDLPPFIWAACSHGPRSKLCNAYLAAHQDHLVWITLCCFSLSLLLLLSCLISAFSTCTSGLASWHPWHSVGRSPWGTQSCRVHWWPGRDTERVATLPLAHLAVKRSATRGWDLAYLSCLTPSSWLRDSVRNKTDIGIRIAHNVNEFWLLNK